MSPVRLLVVLLLLSLLCTPVAAPNGYVLKFEGVRDHRVCMACHKASSPIWLAEPDRRALRFPVTQFTGQIASTRTPVLDSSNGQVARLAHGLTIALWIKFDGPPEPQMPPPWCTICQLTPFPTCAAALLADLTPSRFQPTVQIVHTQDSNWLQVCAPMSGTAQCLSLFCRLQPFGGLHEGYQFGSNGPAAVSTLQGAEAGNWHHYVEAWDGPSGERSIFIDGELISRDIVTPNQTFLDKDARVLIGKYCTGPQGSNLRIEDLSWPKVCIAPRFQATLRPTRVTITCHAPHTATLAS